MRSERRSSGIIAGLPYRRKIFSSAVWTFAIRVLTVVTSLLVAAMLARLLPPDEVGVYFLAFSLATMAVPAAQLGLSPAVVRLISESLGVNKPGRARAAIMATLGYGSLGALGVAALIYFGIGEWIASGVFETTAMAGAMGLVALWIIALTFQNILSAIFRGFQDIHFAVTFGGFFTALITAAIFGVILAVQGRADLNHVLAFSVLAGALNNCLAGIILIPKILRLHGPGHISHRAVHAIAWPLLFGGALNALMMRADVWIVGMYRPAEEVAIYGAASRLINTVAIPTLIIGTVVPPMIAQLYFQGHKQQLERMLRSLATLTAIPCLLLLLIIGFEGDTILGLLFGTFYEAGGLVLTILSAGQLVSAWAGPCAQLLIMAGEERACMVVTIGGAVVAVTLSWLTVGLFGMLGVAGSFAVAMIVMNIAMAGYGARKLGIKCYVDFRFRRFAVPEEGNSPSLERP